MTRYSGADLTGCRIYGVSGWGLKLSAETQQRGLIITPKSEPEITADDIEVAQFGIVTLTSTGQRSAGSGSGP